MEGQFAPVIVNYGIPNEIDEEEPITYEYTVVVEVVTVGVTQLIRVRVSLVPLHAVENYLLPAGSITAYFM